jgi:hypothetical protein
MKNFPACSALPMMDSRLQGCETDLKICCRTRNLQVTCHSLPRSSQIRNDLSDLATTTATTRVISLATLRVRPNSSSTRMTATLLNALSNIFNSCPPGSTLISFRPHGGSKDVSNGPYDLRSLTTSQRCCRLHSRSTEESIREDIKASCQTKPCHCLGRWRCIRSSV